IGHLTGLLVTLKGLPLAYDRDLQEDKEPVFDAVDTLLVVLPATAGMIATMRVDVDRLEASAPEGFALATDVAEYLVRQGVVFRDAHEAVGRLVAWCTEHGCDLHEVPDDDLAALDPHLTPDIRSVLSVAGALEARSTPGGTAPIRVAEQLAAVRAELAERRVWAAHRG
ncbi:MAG: argininosuccinate lyase, partial [Frankiales bacterium]|nr:argininosuccinate lyase [Frankiales bacterium]